MDLERALNVIRQALMPKVADKRTKEYTAFQVIKKLVEPTQIKDQLDIIIEQTLEEYEANHQ